MTPPPATISQIQERFQAHPLPAAIARIHGINQTTLAESLSFSGIGLHSGAEVNVTLKPAAADVGVLFIRTDAPTVEEGLIPALFSRVCDVTLSSCISNNSGYSVGTVEHLMAALYGLGIDNAIIEIDGPEVPIMDGSSRFFVERMNAVGKSELDVARRYLRVTKPVRIEMGDAYCELLPDDRSRFEAVIDFESDFIGRQELALDLDPKSFASQLSEARTFCMHSQVEAMHRVGLALGGSMDNAIVVGDEGVMNEEGLRQQDEFVRHKILDAVGDLFLAGLPIIGCYRGFKSGHALHNKLLHALFTDSDNFELVSAGSQLIAAE